MRFCAAREHTGALCSKCTPRFCSAKSSVAWMVAYEWRVLPATYFARGAWRPCVNSSLSRWMSSSWRAHTASTYHLDECVALHWQVTRTCWGSCRAALTGRSPLRLVTWGYTPCGSGTCLCPRDHWTARGRLRCSCFRCRVHPRGSLNDCIEKGRPVRNSPDGSTTRVGLPRAYEASRTVSSSVPSMEGTLPTKEKRGSSASNSLMAPSSWRSIRARSSGRLPCTRSST